MEPCPAQKMKASVEKLESPSIRRNRTNAGKRKISRKGLIAKVRTRKLSVQSPVLRVAISIRFGSSPAFHPSQTKCITGARHDAKASGLIHSAPTTELEKSCNVTVDNLSIQMLQPLVGPRSCPPNRRQRQWWQVEPAESAHYLLREILRCIAPESNQGSLASVRIWAPVQKNGYYHTVTKCKR